MNFDFDQIISVSLVLFAVIDIIGSIPLIVSLREKAGGHIQSEKATLVATFMLILFLFLGERILLLFGLDSSTFAVAGSIVLFTLALEMILGIEINKYTEPKTVSIVPIAFPLIAGAGSLTTVLSLRAAYQVENIIIGIIVNMIFVYLILKFANLITNFLGSGIISVMQKIFGIILLAISIKLFTTNLSLLIEKL
ncbi:membrane protein, MarC family [Candidatus Ornithobacterium hominis]|uniref:UPF0056 membrane protein n=1 Tax=Candidatus Ornithobacterium hominis TaxID=2497989 RepID=A0A383TVR1_9FLAO|nr:MarC family protein [Candidatus Ornithobacterium hominis]MCT7903907.1 MarC family protein [Candidatus Ornithobacterium hominis]CAI9428597.1 UPF0056 membrane protein [Candidatus Ornithobacterium hominis]SZD71249.1 membrane protein, MarC family [Candidatus Ornithobacterium hominis]SZD71926.1 membrane protein, MarC family [Candidatus Ornithobacterium hominis]